MTSDEQESATVVEDDFSQLRAHKQVWGQKELLGSIIARHFIITGELGGTKWPVWKVVEKDATDVHEQLEKLNHHLDNLGWMAKLELGEPWFIQVIPRPERQFPSLKTTIGFWSFSFITATIAGMLWIEDARPTGGWFVESLMLDAFIGYTMPIVAAIVLASFIQKAHAEKHGLRVGHLTPIPDPSISLFSIGLLPKSLLIWPFGILIIPSLPRMDARPWKDREMLGWSALIVPTTMVSLGVVLWIVGLYLTPEIVAVSSMQYVPEMPLIVNLLSPFLSDGVTTQLVWAHPLSKAGSMLCFFGWISLIPIPTFPGGRLLIARTSMAEARNSTNQLFLFAIILAFAWMFESFASFNIWLPILGIIFPLLLLLGADRRIPLILDEPKKVDFDSVKRMGILLFVIFILALPGQKPYSMDEDWNHEVTYEFEDSIAIVETNGSWNGLLEIDIVNVASITQNWEISIASSDNIASQNWNFEWLCSDDNRNSSTPTGCGDDILPGMVSRVALNVSWDSSQYSPTAEDLYLLTYLDDEPTISTIKLTPEIPQYLNSTWYMNYDSDDVMRCIKIYTNDDLSYNVSFPNSASDFDFETRMYWIDGYQGLEAEITEDIDEICIKGQDPIILLRSYVLNVIKVGEHLFSPQNPVLPMRLITPENGTLVDSTDVRGWGAELESGDILSVSDQTCKLNPMVSTPTKPSNQSQQWVWNTNYRSSSMIPAIQDSDSLLIVFSDEDKVSICSQELYPVPDSIISIDYGPDLILERNGNFYRMWTSIWASAANGELAGNNMSEFVIHNPVNSTTRVNIVQTTSGDDSDEWVIVESVNKILPGENKFTFTPPDNLLSTMYIDYEDGEVYIYLGSYS